MKRLLVVVILALCAASAWAQTPSMTAHFINIGQGESVLLEFPCGAMLIDAGAQDTAARTRLIAYLNKFFARRTDLHRTLNTILITHDHIDHDAALRAVVENFTVEHFVDNGLLTGPGAPNPGDWRLVRTGIAIELPAGTEAQIRPRSGLALEHGVDSA